MAGLVGSHFQHPLLIGFPVCNNRQFRYAEIVSNSSGRTDIFRITRPDKDQADIIKPGGARRRR